MLLTPLNQSNHQVNGKKDQTLPATSVVKISLLECIVLGLHGCKTNHSRKLRPVLQEPWLAAAQPETAGKQPPCLSSRRPPLQLRGETAARCGGAETSRRAAGRAELGSPETLEQGRGGETRGAPLTAPVPNPLGCVQQSGLATRRDFCGYNVKHFRPNSLKKH